jgi:drug/metabolite transporter (DMT)-like permease
VTTAPATRRLDAWTALAVVGLCALWGSNQIAMKIANAGLSPVFQASVRSAGAALLLLGWCAVRRVPLFSGDLRIGYGVAISALFSLEFALLYSGLLYTSASRAVLFLHMAPFVVATGAHFLLPGERLRGWRLCGLALAFTGLALAFADGLRLPRGRELLGDSLELCAAVGWGATTLVIKARGRGVDPHLTLVYQLAGSVLPLWLISRALGEAGVIALTPPVVASMAYQIVVIATFSYLAWIWLLARYPASVLSAFSFWTPLFGLLAGALLLAEPITIALAVAMTLVASGIYLVNRA